MIRPDTSRKSNLVPSGRWIDSNGVSRRDGVTTPAQAIGGISAESAEITPVAALVPMDGSSPNALPTQTIPRRDRGRGGSRGAGAGGIVSGAIRAAAFARRKILGARPGSDYLGGG